MRRRILEKKEKHLYEKMLRKAEYMAKQISYEPTNGKNREGGTRISIIKLYVSNSGSDETGDGSISAPYATLAKVSTIISHNTDIYLDKGSVFEDKLTISGLINIGIKSYGTGQNPQINGLKTVTGFADLGGNIWSVTDVDFPDEITNVFIDGVKALIGHNTASSATGGSNSTLIDTTLGDADGYWDNAEIVIRYYDWNRAISRVSSYASKTFTFPIYYQDTGYYYSVSAGKEYHIQNHLNCLSAQDEWAYNSLTHTLYIYSTAEPANITVTYGDDLIYIVDSQNITIQDIDFYGSAQNGVQIKNSNNVTCSGLKLEWSGIYGIFADTIRDLTISNCEGYDQNNDFIHALSCTGVTIDGSTGLRCGVDPAAQRYMPVPYKGGTGGVTMSKCTNVTITDSEVAYTAYNGIAIYYVNNFLVENNYVHHYTLNKHDGGGIYTALDTYYPTSNDRILSNIVTDGIVSENSSAIYPDIDSKGIEIAYNFVDQAKYGFHLHNSAEVNLHDNIIVTAEDQSSGVYHSMTKGTAIDNIINNNVYIHKSNTTPSVYIKESSTNSQTYTNNEYFYPVGYPDDDGMARIVFPWYTLAEWIADESRVTWTRTGEVELDTSVSPRALPEHNFVKTFTNPETSTIESTDMPYDDYVEYDGTAISFPVTVPSNSAKVYVRKPVPEFYIGRTDGTTVEIESTVRLDDTSIPATTAFTLPAKTVTNVAISENVITVTVNPAYNPGDDLSVTYTKPGNNPLKAYYGSNEMDSFSESLEDLYFTLTATGTGLGVAALRIVVSEDVDVTVDGAAFLYDDAAGTVNPEKTKTITAGVWTYLYIRCPAGASNMSLSNGKKLTDIKSWSSPVNAPSLGGDLGQFSSLTYVLMTGKNTISGNIENLPMINTLIVYDSNTLSGDIESLELLGVCDIRGANTVTFSSVDRLKKLVNFRVDTANTLTSENVNLLLSEMWANRDHTKADYTQRIINLQGSPSTGAPTGQGITDKTNLGKYRSPYQDPDYNFWTVTTR